MSVPWHRIPQPSRQCWFAARSFQFGSINNSSLLKSHSRAHPFRPGHPLRTENWTSRLQSSLQFSTRSRLFSMQTAGIFGCCRCCLLTRSDPMNLSRSSSNGNHSTTDNCQRNKAEKSDGRQRAFSRDCEPSAASCPLLKTQSCVFIMSFGSIMFKRTCNVDWRKMQCCCDDHRTSDHSGTAGRSSTRRRGCWTPLVLVKPCRRQYTTSMKKTLTAIFLSLIWPSFFVEAAERPCPATAVSVP
jgi:hypothetical protein